MPIFPRRSVAYLGVAALLIAGCGDDVTPTTEDAVPSVTVEEPGATDPPTTPPTVSSTDDTTPPTVSSTDDTTPPTVSSTDDTTPPVAWWPADPRASPSVARWTVEVVERIDHDPAAFTQGLEVTDGVGFESTGRRGESTIRRFDPMTGSVLASVDLDPDLFGEGLTVVDDIVIQLTWRAGTALRWDRDTLTAGRTSSYEGEGWGLCAQAEGLVLSDGTSRVRIVDPETFDVQRTVDVTLDGEPVSRLNELECVDELVVANIWTTSRVIVFEPDTGSVLAEIDASALTEEMADAVPIGESNILNGIAALDDGSFLLSGKLWPTTFLVRLTQS